MQDESREKMSSLEKGIYLLRIFSEEPYEFTVPDLVLITGFNRTTVYRILSTFEEAGMLIRDERGKSYKIGPMTYHLGNVYLHHANYKDSIQAILERISEESKESVGIAHREGNKVVSIYAIETHQHLKVNDRPGTYYPMNKGCYGKCLMAYHDQTVVRELLEGATFDKTASGTLTDKEEILREYQRIRDNGFVESIDEVASYICGIGLPLKSPNGRVENVVAISFFRQEDYIDKLKKMKDILFKYKAELEKYLI